MQTDHRQLTLEKRLTSSAPLGLAASPMEPELRASTSECVYMSSSDVSAWVSKCVNVAACKDRNFVLFISVIAKNLAYPCAGPHVSNMMHTSSEGDGPASGGTTESSTLPLPSSAT